MDIIFLQGDEFETKPKIDAMYHLERRTTRYRRPDSASKSKTRIGRVRTIPIPMNDSEGSSGDDEECSVEGDLESYGSTDSGRMHDYRNNYMNTTCEAVTRIVNKYNSNNNDNTSSDNTSSTIDRSVENPEKIPSSLLEEAPNLYSNLQIYIASRAHGKTKEGEEHSSKRNEHHKEEKKLLKNDNEDDNDNELTEMIDRIILSSTTSSNVVSPNDSKAFSSLPSPKILKLNNPADGFIDEVIDDISGNENESQNENDSESENENETKREIDDGKYNGGDLEIKEVLGTDVFTFVPVFLLLII